MNIGETLRKWDDAKKKMEILDEKIKRYKNSIAKEMNKQNIDRLSEDGFTVTRRRNTRTYLTKDNVPSDIWKEYSTKCSFDSFFISTKR